ncbi:MAG TPA: 16S rRNA (cytidine(1402)-2'-O)-methyltransferase [Desulfobacteraceae bacterium]|nr:16S rRNA (cytidine(1402)-2'-O)-methyltransferase [Desulfobacteraceae bacterium]
MKDKVSYGTENQGVLYVVSTPIGNLEDISMRAIRILKSVDMIAAENMAHSRGLCEHYGIKTRLTSYNQHNQKIKATGLIKRLRSGHNIAIVTDAGTPGISDPGVYLVSQAANLDIKTIPIPGASAVTSALSVSGMPTEQFVFLGFLPNKPGKRKRVLTQLISEYRVMVFFEAPHRIKAMLTDLREILGDRQMVMLREMTKVFEEVKRGPVSAVLKHLTQDRLRGEFTLVVKGYDGQKQAQTLSEEIQGRMKELLIEKKMGVKDIAHLISGEEGLTYRQIYRECLARKREFEGLKQMELVKSIEITNDLGLHARAAAKIVEIANKYKSGLFLKKSDQEVDGGSILSILTLSCPKGTEIEVRIVGEDSESFMEELSELFENKFGESR